MAQIIMTTEVKSPCILCNNVPHDDTKENRPILEMFHSVGVDVNWGEDANVCQICARVMAEQLGMVEPGAYDKLMTRHNSLKERYAELQDKFDDQKERIKAILAGRKATKEQKEAA